VLIRLERMIVKSVRSDTEAWIEEPQHMQHIAMIQISGTTRPGPGPGLQLIGDITDCHYVSDFARDEVVPDQTPVLVR